MEARHHLEREPLIIIRSFLDHQTKKISHDGVLKGYSRTIENSIARDNQLRGNLLFAIDMRHILLQAWLMQTFLCLWQGVVRTRFFKENLAIDPSFVEHDVQATGHAFLFTLGIGSAEKLQQTATGPPCPFVEREDT